MLIIHIVEVGAGAFIYTHVGLHGSIVDEMEVSEMADAGCWEESHVDLLFRTGPQKSEAVQESSGASCGESERQNFLEQ